MAGAFGSDPTRRTRATPTLRIGRRDARAFSVALDSPRNRIKFIFGGKPRKLKTPINRLGASVSLVPGAACKQPPGALSYRKLPHSRLSVQIFFSSDRFLTLKTVRFFSRRGNQKARGVFSTPFFFHLPRFSSIFFRGWKLLISHPH